MSWKRWLLYLTFGTILGGVVAALFLLIFLPYRDLDILISNGTVVDGSGGPPRVCDVAIRNGKIAGLSSWRFYFSRAKVHIDAAGRIVAPGFIDVHTHVEPNIPPSGPFRADNFLRQGVTTIITGNCGRSRTDIAALFQGLEKNGTYVNVATLIGHNSVRQQVMAFASRHPTSEELNRMETIVDRAIKDGAVGLSTGLVYLPGRFAETSEVVALAKVAADEGGLYASHIRNEGPQGIAALREALDIGRQAGAATEISHFKSTGPRQWHTISQRLALLDEARLRGQTVTIDVYPYARSSTTTDVLLPDWALRDNRLGLKEVIASSEARRKLREDILSRMNEEGWKDFSFVKLAAGRREWIGKTLAQVPIAARDLNQQVENLIEISLLGGAQAVYADMDEQDVAEAATNAYCTFGSDSSVRDPKAEYLPHPRGYGTFPRIFRRYVREQGLLTMTAAVHKASGQAAEAFHLGNRGVLKSGYWADITVFDANKIEDRADYDQPFAPPLGIDYVIVNGVVAVDHGNLTANSPRGMPVRFH
ncbi:MAG TPA: amidohydrolase family protein [Pyrinomonadaceae bacterium]|nr:amidohydrolase family protein [Pyrinomonadaceae bacterium]